MTAIPAGLAKGDADIQPKELDTLKPPPPAPPPPAEPLPPPPATTK